MQSPFAIAVAIAAAGGLVRGFARRRAKTVAGSIVCGLALAAAGCNGTTGSGLVTFAAAAAGPADAPGAGTAWVFDTPVGAHVTLTEATLHIGAVYLNAGRPVSGGQATSCILPGVYVAEVTRGLEVDLLNPTPQLFPVDGDGKTEPAETGEVWLMGTSDVNALVDPTPILTLAGTATTASTTATSGATPLGFSASLTISSNRVVPPTNAALPGAHPLCKERIVSPIPTNVTPSAVGTLVARIDPRQLLGAVTFDDPDFLAKDGTPDGTAVVFDDDSSTAPGRALYQALHAAALVYQFDWETAGP